MKKTLSQLTQDLWHKGQLEHPTAPFQLASEVYESLIKRHPKRQGLRKEALTQLHSDILHTLRILNYGRLKRAPTSLYPPPK